MKKPDRFERMVPGWEQMDHDDMRACLVPATTMVKALRLQYQQIRRVIHQTYQAGKAHGNWQLSEPTILAALDRWRNG